MRNRRSRVLALALPMALAVSGVAFAAGDGVVGPGSPPDPTPTGLSPATGKYQTIKYSGMTTGTPKFVTSGVNNMFVSGFTKPSGKLSKSAKNVAMTIRTATGNKESGGQTLIPASQQAGIPAPAVRAQVYFDKDITLNLSGIPRCDDVTVSGLATPQAREACKASIVGSGTARIRVPGFFDADDPFFGAPDPSVAVETEVQLTAFLGQKDSAGNETIILYSRAPALNAGSALIGTLRPAGRAGYGRLLDVYIPVLAANAALVQFEMTVGNGKSYASVTDNPGTTVDERALPGVGKSGFVKAKCIGDRKLKLTSRFYFSNYGGDNGGPSYDPAKPWTGLAADQAPDNYLDASHTLRCKV